MKTLIADSELEDELQELYILSTHWISDINFIEDETRFLKNVIDKYLAPILKDDQLAKAKDFNKTLVQLETGIPMLKIKISDFLHFINPMINESNKEIGVNLLEKFTSLETEMKSLFESVKKIKKSLFSFTEEIMKTEKCSIFLNQF